MKKTSIIDNQKVIAVIGLVFSSAVLILATPRMLSSLYALYPDAAYKQIKNTITPDVYQNSITHLKQALSWNKNPLYLDKDAFFHLSYYNNPTHQGQLRDANLLAQSHKDLANSLSLSPVNPFGWLQFAIVANQLKTPKKQIIEAINSSFYAGRIEPELTMTRLTFSYNFYADFTEELQNQWQKQLLFAWTLNTNEVIEFIALHPDAKTIALEAFKSSPEGSKKFNIELDNYYKKITTLIKSIKS